MSRRPHLRRLLRLILLLAALALGGLALSNRWGDVRGHLSELRATTLAPAFGAALVALFAGMMSWRALLADVGNPLKIRPATRIVFLSQIGKYVPGSVWPYLAQVELGREYNIPRTRCAAVSVLAALVSLVSGLLLATLTMPWASPSAARRFWPAFLAIPVLGTMLYPPILNVLTARALRLLRRPPLEQRLSGRGIAISLGWAGLVWFVSGVQVWLISKDVAQVGIGDLPTAVGAYGLAWSIGFLVVIAPAGAGVREAVLTAALAPIMATSASLVVALVSRLLMTVSDLVLAGTAIVLHPRRSQPTGHTRPDTHNLVGDDHDGEPLEYMAPPDWAP